MQAQIEMMQEMLKKELEDLKNKQAQMNNKITEMKNTRKWIQQWGRRMDKWVGIQNCGNHCHRTEYKEKRMKRNEESLRDLRSNIKCTNIFIIGPHKKREKRPEKIFEEIAAEKFQHGKGNSPHVQKAQRVPGRINTRRNTQYSQ